MFLIVYSLERLIYTILLVHSPIVGITFAGTWIIAKMATGRQLYTGNSNKIKNYDKIKMYMDGTVS